MDLNTLTAISPIDGRYHKATQPLAAYFSEFGLIKYRVLVEVEYLIALSKKGLPQLQPFSESQESSMRALYMNFSEADAAKIKKIESVTNHDVKAVEYFLKEKMEQMGLGEKVEFVHFGLTSQDINNTAIPLSLLHGIRREVLPLLEEIVQSLESLAADWENIPMLARTHGQPASPTRLGKEMRVFTVRLREQMIVLEQIPFAGKFGGATGNFNAHYQAYPMVDWHGFADEFLKNTLGLKRSHPTTQIEHYDHLASLFDAFKRISVILIDFARDVWQYIAMNYFKQKINPNEVGSSAMPHKVNPIDFENAEGNLGLAIAIFEHLSCKLPISRLQRDLTDSTVLRNVGVPFGHFQIALRSLKKGLGKLELNSAAINRDLQENWAVVAEAIQTILRREGYPKPYEALKALTRTNADINEHSIRAFILGLPISEEVKSELMAITPFTYTGKG